MEAEYFWKFGDISGPCAMTFYSKFSVKLLFLRGGINVTEDSLETGNGVQ